MDTRSFICRLSALLVSLMAVTAVAVFVAIIKGDNYGLLVEFYGYLTVSAFTCILFWGEPIPRAFMAFVAINASYAFSAVLLAPSWAAGDGKYTKAFPWCCYFFVVSTIALGAYCADWYFNQKKKNPSGSDDI